MANKNIRNLSTRKGIEENLFENIAQLSHKAASEAEYHKLAQRFMVDDSVIFATSSFYDFLKPENLEKKVHVCNGTACLVANSQKALKKLLEVHISEDEIR